MTNRDPEIWMGGKGFRIHFQWQRVGVTNYVIAPPAAVSGRRNCDPERLTKDLDEILSPPGVNFDREKIAPLQRDPKNNCRNFLMISARKHANEQSNLVQGDLGGISAGEDALTVATEGLAA